MTGPHITVRIPPELRVFVAAARRRGGAASAASHGPSTPAGPADPGAAEAAGAAGATGAAGVAAAGATTVVTAIDGTSSLGHVVESLGVPLTEVGGLGVDGRPVAAAHVPSAGEEVTVRPVARPQRVPGAPLRFLLDVHLGTLARRLRLLGVDTAYESADIGDPALAARSAAERRVLLSRDRGLLRRRELWSGAYVYSDRPQEQVRDVLERFAPPLAPWTRCVACNGPLAAADKDEVRDRLADGTRRSYDVFARCTQCERVYWKGAHHERLQAVVDEAVRPPSAAGRAGAR